MAFATSLSGLYGASIGLDVIGNNLANASTAGFKGHRAEFADLFTTYMQSQSQASGTGTLPVGVQQFTQGNIASSGNMLDLSINGNGMFMVSSDAASTERVAFTRNGEFHFAPVSTATGTSTNERYIANSTGNYLMGWADGVDTTTPPTALVVGADMAPLATSTSTIRVNLDDRATAIPATTAFSPSDPTSFNWSTSQTIYSGVAGDVTAHDLRLYFAKADANTWNVYSQVDGGAAITGPSGLTFSSTGLLLTGGNLPISGTLTAAVPTTDPVTGATTNTSSSVPVNFTVDLSGSTQFASGYDTAQSIQNGYAAGSLANMRVLRDGTIEGQFSNQQTMSLGKVALATFVNPNGLKSMGDNLWLETRDSGAANVGTAAAGGRGVIDGYSLEQSNVDLSAQLIDMITMQRNYQANAQSIKTQDDVLKTLSALR